MFDIAQLSILQKSIVAVICMGICSGMLGTFVVVRRVALVGDALAHAVLPGVVTGFMLSKDQNIWVIFLCALITGLFGIFVVRLIVQTTRVKSDAALGIVLASFFAVGVFMNSMNPQAGVDEFLFGDISRVSNEDLRIILIVTLLVAAVVIGLFRPFRIMSFDEGFAIGLGYPTKILNAVFFALLGFAVVVTMQAVGVILVSAMFVTPAATAYMLSERIRKMMLLAVCLSTAAGLLGNYLSTLFDLPTGALIALVSAFMFAIVYLIAPQYGIVAKMLRNLQREKRVHRENTLKAIYKQIEYNKFDHYGVSLEQLAKYRKMPLDDLIKDCNELVQAGEATWHEAQSAIYLTTSGWRRAVEIVRNHRLWELYLTNEANYASDHVHDDAEKIEHILGAETVRKLERDLNFPAYDPHGSPIPTVDKTLELEGSTGLDTKPRDTGY